MARMPGDWDVSKYMEQYIVEASKNFLELEYCKKMSLEFDKMIRGDWVAKTYLPVHPVEHVAQSFECIQPHRTEYDMYSCDKIVTWFAKFFYKWETPDGYHHILNSIEEKFCKQRISEELWRDKGDSAFVHLKKIACEQFSRNLVDIACTGIECDWSFAENIHEDQVTYVSVGDRVLCVPWSIEIEAKACRFEYRSEEIMYIVRRWDGYTKEGVW